MLSTPRKKGSISVGCSSGWETTKIRSFVEFRVPGRKADNPLSSLTEGLQVNLKASLSVTFRANPGFAL